MSLLYEHHCWPWHSNLAFTSPISLSRRRAVWEPHSYCPTGLAQQEKNDRPVLPFFITTVGKAVRISHRYREVPSCLIFSWNLSSGCWQVINPILRALFKQAEKLFLCSFHPRVLVSSPWTTKNKSLHCFPWEPFRMLQTDGVFALWLLISLLFSVVPTDTPFLSSIVSSTLPS